MTLALLFGGMLVSLFGTGQQQVVEERVQRQFLQGQDAKAYLQDLERNDAKAHDTNRAIINRLRAQGLRVSEDVFVYHEKRIAVNEPPVGVGPVAWIRQVLHPVLHAQHIQESEGEVIFRPFDDGDEGSAEFNAWIRNYQGIGAELAADTQLQLAALGAEAALDNPNIWNEQIIACGQNASDGWWARVQQVISPTLLAQGRVWRTVPCADTGGIARRIVRDSVRGATPGCLASSVPCLWASIGYLGCVGGSCAGNLGGWLIYTTGSMIWQCTICAEGYRWQWSDGGRCVRILGY